MLKTALIGMSGSGKTFWSNKLVASSYRQVSCDDRIERKLAPELPLTCRGIGGVAAWMGWPDVADYRVRAQKYLESEIAVMREILRELANSPEEKIVVDTTGSVIYTGEKLCGELHAQATIIYLEASREEQQMLVERYLRDPKPVLWGEQFQPRQGETSRDTVARCFPQLIEYRRTKYEELAHLVLPISELRGADLTGDDFLRVAGKRARSRR